MCVAPWQRGSAKYRVMKMLAKSSNGAGAHRRGVWRMAWRMAAISITQWHRRNRSVESVSREISMKKIWRYQYQ